MAGLAKASARDGAARPISDDQKDIYLQKRLVGIIKRQTPVVDAKAGEYTVPVTANTLKKLNENALRVLDALWMRRDQRALTHVTIPGIARVTGQGTSERNGYPQTPMAERTVRSSLERLKKAGLIVNLGWTFQLVQCKCTGKLDTCLHEVYLRQVKGHLFSTPHTETGFSMRVPADTWKWLREVKMHGGSRAGAGRPQGRKDTTSRKKFVEPETGNDSTTAPLLSLMNPELAAAEPSPKGWAPKPEAQNSRSAPYYKHQEPDHTSPTEKHSQGTGEPDSHSLALAHPRPDGSTICEGSGSRSLTTSSSCSHTLATPANRKVTGTDSLRAPPEAVAAGRALWAVREDVPGRLAYEGGANGLARAAVWAPSPVVPRQPGPATISAARVPDPPKLNPRYSDDGWVEVCRKAFRTVAGKRFGEQAERRARYQAKSKKLYQGIHDTAQLLAKHDISPVLWVLWSFNIWRDFSNNKQKTPPLAWVFLPSRVEKRHGWFHGENSVALGGKMIFSPSHLELGNRWLAMQRAIGSGIDEQVAVDAFFPDGLYDRLIQRAHVETAEIQLDLNQRAKAGAFLWD